MTITQPHPFIVEARAVNRLLTDYVVVVTARPAPLEPPAAPSTLRYGDWGATGDVVQGLYGSWHVAGAEVDVIYGEWA